MALNTININNNSGSTISSTQPTSPGLWDNAGVLTWFDGTTNTVVDINYQDDITSENTTSFNLIANIPYVHTSTFSNIVEVSVYKDNENIADSLQVDVTGSTITIESNINISNLTLKIIGNGT